MVEKLSLNQNQFKSPRKWRRAQPLLELLSALSYRSEALDSYLEEIARGVSQLLSLDWSVVTFCWANKEKVMASSRDLGEGEHVYSLHGTLTHTVVSTGKTLQVQDVLNHPEYGKSPEGYRSYLGVPLRTPGGEVIGTICSFCVQRRYFTEEELRTVELFAERAAIAIDNYNLYRQQQDFNQALEAKIAIRTEELKATQAKLIEQEKLAAIGQFASMIVHEIRNPLTTILMGLNALNQLKLDERERMRLTLSLEESNRLQNLLQEILVYAKPKILEPEELDPCVFLIEMVPCLRQMPMALERKIEFIPLQEEIKIRADKHKLKQVLINLVQNACEAISSGEIVTCMIKKEEDSGYVRFIVHNGGPPIPKDILPKLTEPFVSNKCGGTGLGLAIVKQIVGAHQGTLLIQSNAFDGTTISFTIPICSDPQY